MSVLDYLYPPILPEILGTPSANAFGSHDEKGAYGGFGYQSPDGNTQSTYAEGGIGTWTDQKGGVNRGFNVQGGAYKTGEEDSGYTLFGQRVGYDVGLGTAQAGIYERTTVREDGKTARTESVGIQGNAIEASTTVGDDNNNVRFGLSAGEGLGAREHLVDIDGDGETETAGFGVDVGPVSFDFKSDMLAELVKDAPNMPDMEDMFDLDAQDLLIPDMMQNPDDYEMPNLDDYEMPSLDNLPNLDNYEFPDITDVPSIDEMMDSVPDYPLSPANPILPAADEAPIPPTGLLDEADIDLINHGYDPDMIVG